MTTAYARRQLPEEFQRLNLTPEYFHTFYSTFMALRFPLDVAEVLDLRYLINHAVDDFAEPPITLDYRQFRESLDKALDSFAVENPHHRERMLKTLTLIRELHVAHSLASRDAEERLRVAQEDNRLARRAAVRGGLVYLFITVLSIVGWFALIEAEWLVKLLSALCAFASWRHFRALPRLDRQAQQLRLDLNELLRRRVNSLNWKTLIHKLALVLGFKQIKGVEVFSMNERADTTGPYH